jgi:hypothetical protein
LRQLVGADGIPVFGVIGGARVSLSGLYLGFEPGVVFHNAAQRISHQLRYRGLMVQCELVPGDTSHLNVGFWTLNLLPLWVLPDARFLSIHPG